jgi:hypothetical protein
MQMSVHGESALMLMISASVHLFSQRTEVHSPSNNRTPALAVKFTDVH